MSSEYGPRLDPGLEEALSISHGLPATAANLERVGNSVGPELAREAFGQWDLRARARAKFSRAEEMLFTAEALEQATHERVAAYHASLFPSGATVADLTAGIGSDSIALARRGPVIAFELDPMRAVYLRHNLALYSRSDKVRLGHSLDSGDLLPGAAQDHVSAEIFEGNSLESGDLLAGSAENHSSAEVFVGDSLNWLRRQVGRYVFADPSRRTGGKRTLDPNEFSPNPSLVADLGRAQRLCVMKLSPLLNDDFLAALGPRLEFVSFARECREALVICGSEAEPGRFAVLAETGERLKACEAPQSAVVDRWLFDADPAAVRAHALGSLSARFGVCAVGDSNGYLTGPQLVESAWMSAYEVLYEGPGDLKRTRAELRGLGSKTPVIKQRGAKLDLPSLQKSLRMEGERELTLILYPVGRSVRHIIAAYWRRA